MNEHTSEMNSSKSNPAEKPQNQLNSKGQELSFQELYAQSLNQKDLKEGDVVSGKVIKVTPDFVIVDIGYKTEGQIDIREFTSPQGKINVEIGQEVNVYLEKIEDDDGYLVLSKDKADVLKAWDNISTASEKDEVVEGVVVTKIKGGLTVDIGVKAFLPGSQIDLRPVKNLDQYIGKTFKFKIIKFNRKRGNIVLSRRALLESQREHLKSQTLESIKENQIVDGIVKNITDYGVFVDLGGIDGLLHITDMSWGRIKHPSEMFSIGDDIKVKVLKYDHEKERVSLGLKQLRPDPWQNIREKFPISSKITGKVISLTDYGAFIELEEGVEGLIHISEMSWTRKIQHPSEILQSNKAVEAMVLDIDEHNKKISLGLKQIEPSPWEIVEKKYPSGSQIKGKVKNITDFGVFVGIDEGIDGLVHISDVSWSSKAMNLKEQFTLGQPIDVVVLHVDKENEKFSLGIKQLTDDPWSNLEKKYKANSKHEAVVSKLTDVGIFVKLEEEVEGLIHKSEMNELKNEPGFIQLNVGDKVNVSVTHFDRKDRKISLSIRAYERSLERENLATYLESENKQSRVNLGDVIGQELKEKMKLKE